jgi:chorismate mutase
MTDEFDPILKPYRAKIDSLDEKIVKLLVEREHVINEVAKIKFRENIPPVLPARVEEVRENAVAMAKNIGGDENYMREIYTKIIELSCEIEEKAKDE